MFTSNIQLCNESIIKKGDCMRIELPEQIGSYQIYEEVLPKLAYHYSQRFNQEEISFSLRKVKYIKAEAIPLFMCILNVMKNYHNKPMR